MGAGSVCFARAGKSFVIEARYYADGKSELIGRSRTAELERKRSRLLFVAGTVQKHCKRKRSTFEFYRHDAGRGCSPAARGEKSIRHSSRSPGRAKITGNPSRMITLKWPHETLSYLKQIVPHVSRVAYQLEGRDAPSENNLPRKCARKRRPLHVRSDVGGPGL